MLSEDSFSYVGKLPCGCVVAAVVDNPAHARAVANEVRNFIRDGLTVERVPSQYVRDHFTELAHCPHKGPQQLLLFEEVKSSEKVS